MLRNRVILFSFISSPLSKKHFHSVYSSAKFRAHSKTSSFQKMASMASGTLQELGARADHSWISELTGDIEAVQHSPNKVSREVKSGHFVPVLPSPLPQPSLVIFSTDMANELGLSSETCNSDQFIRYFSGDVNALLKNNANKTNEIEAIDPLMYCKDPLNSNLALLTWCTPYALSIMGTPYYNNCPFGTGNGYGDGRAISIGEVVIPKEACIDNAFEKGISCYQEEVSQRAAYPLRDPLRWEMQLKGAGTTPFCRGADGRAVLRSSIREFLASEAMHRLGVPTTRALSLIKSDSEKARRGWYSGKIESPLSIDDPRLAGMPLGKRQSIVERYTKEASGQPDMAIFEPCAMTCRVSPSFTRIGHIDLFARRVRNKKNSEEPLTQLKQIVKHAIKREYPELLLLHSNAGEGEELNAELLLAFLDASAQRLSSLTANWLRVGFAQGNFNADNCLLGGRTMDYGPFGFMEGYQRNFAKWTGSGDHFGFINQPQAGFVNWQVLVQSVAPLLDTSDAMNDKVEQCVEAGMTHFVQATRRVWRRKLGFSVDDKDVTLESHPSVDLFARFENLLTRNKGTDFTIVFRELATVIESTRDGLKGEKWSPSSSRIFSQNSELMQPLTKSFEASFLQDNEGVCGVSAGGEDAVSEKEWSDWIRDWLMALEEDDGDAQTISKRLRSANPKYVAREWMLVEAYEKANEGDFEMVHRIHQVLSFPYDDQSEETSGYRGRKLKYTITDKNLQCIGYELLEMMLPSTYTFSVIEAIEKDCFVFVQGFEFKIENLTNQMRKTEIIRHQKQLIPHSSVQIRRF